MILDVQGDSITVDAPFTCAIEKRWGGGEVLKYEDTGRIEKVGVENLRGMSEFDPTKRTREYGNMDRPNYVAEEYYNDENHTTNAAKLGRLLLAFEIGCILLTVEIGVWLAALAN